MNLTTSTSPNIEIIENFALGTANYAPDQSCFDWCSIQHVVHSNNMELTAIIFVVIAYFCIVASEMADEIKILKPYKNNFVYFAKLLIVVFLGFYILIIRMRLIW